MDYSEIEALCRETNSLLSDAIDINDRLLNTTITYMKPAAPGLKPKFFMYYKVTDCMLHIIEHSKAYTEQELKVAIDSHLTPELLARRWLVLIKHTAGISDIKYPKSIPEPVYSNKGQGWVYNPDLGEFIKVGNDEDDDS